MSVAVAVEQERWRWDHFKVGDLVTWADDHFATLVCSRERYGDGPFVVLSVEPIPYLSREVPYDLALAPPEISNWASAGHTQYVIIDHAGEGRRYSGAFFRLAVSR